MKLSSRGVELIKRYEGLSLSAYLCPAGKWTIGYGHVMQPSDAAIITRKQADELLMQDVLRFEEAINQLVSVPLTQGQYDALTSLCYNIGIAAFSRSTLLKKLNNNDFSGASAQFVRWVYAGGKLLTGLEKRRRAEQQFFD